MLAAVKRQQDRVDCRPHRHIAGIDLRLTNAYRAQPHPDVLRLAECHKPFGSEFASQPRELPAPKRRLQFGRVVDVYPDGAGFQLLNETPCALEIPRIDVGGEAEREGISDRKRLSFVSNPSHSGDRAIALLRHHERGVVRAVDQSRIEKEATAIYAPSEETVDVGGLWRCAAAVEADGADGDAHGRSSRTQASPRSEAASLVKPGQFMFLDSGSTNLALISCLPEDFELTIATNSIDIAAAALRRSDLRLIYGRRRCQFQRRRLR